MTNDPKMGWAEELKSVLESSLPQDEKSETHLSFHDDEQPDSWRRRYSQDAPWDVGIPLSIEPAVKHLKKVFDRVHSAVGLFTTQRLCYASLHNGSGLYSVGGAVDG